jgi:hypothetical protein
MRATIVPARQTVIVEKSGHGAFFGKFTGKSDVS